MILPTSSGPGGGFGGGGGGSSSLGAAAAASDARRAALSAARGGGGGGIASVSSSSSSTRPARADKEGASPGASWSGALLLPRRLEPLSLALFEALSLALLTPPLLSLPCSPMSAPAAISASRLPLAPFFGGRLNGFATAAAAALRCASDCGRAGLRACTGAVDAASSPLGRRAASMSRIALRHRATPTRRLM